MSTKNTNRFFLLLVIMLTAGFNANAQQAPYSVDQVTSTLPSRVWINITGPTGGTSQAAIAYLSQGTFGLDFGYDATRFLESNTISIYTIAENTPLVIQTRPLFSNLDVVQMGYAAPQAGNYSLSIDHKDGIFNNGQHIYIKDITTGEVTDLNNGALFFTSLSGTFENRFQLMYMNTTMGTEQPVFNSNSVTVAKSAQTITISVDSNLIDAVTIYDINGRKVYSANGINTEEITINDLTASKQILIVEVSTAKGKVNKKIIY
nr:T9SS sorting signal type C domain-containing protein [uncultured Flavobacterium sp.]